MDAEQEQFLSELFALCERWRKTARLDYGSLGLVNPKTLTVQVNIRLKEAIEVPILDPQSQTIVWVCSLSA